MPWKQFAPSAETATRKLDRLPDQLGNQGITSRGGGAGRVSSGVGCGVTCSTGCGGGAIRSATLTGFGVRVGGGVFEKKECSGGGWLREIAIVCGTNPFFANVTDWLSTDNVSEHGVWQVWPAAVLTAAPLGTDSNCTVCGDGVDGGSGADRPNISAEHPVRALLIVAAIATRTNPVRGMTASVPEAFARLARSRDTGHRRRNRARCGASMVNGRLTRAGRFVIPGPRASAEPGIHSR